MATSHPRVRSSRVSSFLTLDRAHTSTNPMTRLARSPQAGVQDTMSPDTTPTTTHARPKMISGHCRGHDVPLIRAITARAATSARKDVKGPTAA